MTKDEVRYGYALLDDTKHTVSIDDIDRPFTRLHKFYCPHCHNEMYATFGDVQLRHFRHNGEKCQHSKYLHNLAEHVFYEEYSKCLENGLPFYLVLYIPRPCNKSCVLKKHADCKEHYYRKKVELTKEYTLISLETRVDIDDRYRRPDILLESLDGKQLWVEIWVSHETEEDKRKDGRIVEIKIDTENDLEIIRQHKIVQSEGDDLAVRIFNIKTDEPDDLFEYKESIPIITYPCDKYYCYEVRKSGVTAEVIDYIRTETSSDLLYRVSLRLNWKGSHDVMEGSTGKQIKENDLIDVCRQRLYSYGKDNLLYQDKSYDSLVASEWKAASNPKPNQYSKPYYRSYNRPRYQPTSHPAPVSVDVSDMEWVDLGLPSGTLWAKDDVVDKMSFMDALRSCGSHMPSKTDAYELKEYCTREWDDSVRAIVFTGPNGKSISFPCKKDKSYWLNSYDEEDQHLGQCFHLGSDNSFWINDTNSDSEIFVRLVSK